MDSKCEIFRVSFLYEYEHIGRFHIYISISVALILSNEVSDEVSLNLLKDKSIHQQNFNALLTEKYIISFTDYHLMNLINTYNIRTFDLEVYQLHFF